MLWDKNYNSSEIEDRRGDSGGGGGGLGGGGSLALLSLFSRFGWKGTLLGLLVVGGLALSHLGSGGSSAPAPQQTQPSQAPSQAPSRSQGATIGNSAGSGEDALVHFVGFTFDDVQTTWRKQLTGYTDSHMVLFRGSLPSGCGTATTSAGPFYCPRDKKVYLDLAFYDELRRRFGSPGDFAQAYVIAHELGHHVQDLAGLLDRGTPSVTIELQADCLAGAWAKDADSRGIVEAGDVAGALHAAAAIGDDAIQKQTQGYVRPETFTHGSSAQRTAAFQKGLDGGADACLHSKM